jgi:hypothetical protein
MNNQNKTRIARVPISLNRESNRIGFLWKTVVSQHSSKYNGCQDMLRVTKFLEKLFLDKSLSIN